MGSIGPAPVSSLPAVRPVLGPVPVTDEQTRGVAREQPEKHLGVFDDEAAVQHGEDREREEYREPERYRVDAGDGQVSTGRCDCPDLRWGLGRNCASFGIRTRHPCSPYYPLGPPPTYKGMSVDVNSGYFASSDVNSPS